MTSRFQWWTPRAARKRPLTISNRAVLCFESLETRTLLSSGIFQTLAFDNPTANLALVLEPSQSESGSTHAHHGLTDTVGLDGSMKVLAHQHQIVMGPESLADLERDRLGDPAATLQPLTNENLLQSFHYATDNAAILTSSRLFADLNALLAREFSFFFTPSILFFDPFAGLGSSIAMPSGSTSMTRTAASDASATTNGQPLQILNLQTLMDLSQLSGNVVTDVRTASSDPSTPATIQTQTATVNQSNASTGSTTGVIRNNSTSSNGHAATDPRMSAAVNNTSTAPTIAPDLVRNAATPVTTTTQPVVVPAPSATTATGTTTATAVPPPAVPVAPAQEVLAGTLDTTTPYARFEQTIQTKEGYKTANGEVQTVQPSRQAPVIKPVNQEQEEADLILDANADSAADQAALHRRRLDALYADPNGMAQDEGSTRSHAGMAIAAIVLGSFWGAQSRKEENRKRRQRALVSLWKRIWR